jgi:Zn-dependent protease with chaperone function
MVSMSQDSDTGDRADADGASAGQADNEAAVDRAQASSAEGVYFDGISNRRQVVTVTLGNQLVMRSDDNFVSWAYSDIRRADSPAGSLRVSSLSAPPLARLEIRDSALAAELAARCSRIDEYQMNGGAVARIVGWSLAAVASIFAVVLLGVPLAADRLTPLVPRTMERHLGEAAERQLEIVFGDKICNGATGQAAFVKLVDALRLPAGLDDTVTASVLNTPIPNAYALPGGRFFLLSGLLEKAHDPDEIAGVLAHELGHLKHRDNVRELIHNGGSSFLIGLLFGDITGAGAALFASRTLVSASYSREAERDADSFAIEVMHALGRPTGPMGELMFRVTGKEGDKRPSILASHPLSEDRLRRMRAEDRPPSGPALLTTEEWDALKGICR